MQNYQNDLRRNARRRGEAGNATVKFLLVAVALFVVGYAGFNYLMIWYQATQFTEAMNEDITRAFSMPNTPYNTPETIKKHLRKKGDELGVPAEAVMKIEKQKDGIAAQVSFTREVSILPFNLYNYQYQYNHTAAPPTGFLTK